ncbi:MAG: hypothetical protein P8011_16270 [Acidihalobacter sp.]|jgi:molybdopterin/thiamine biosynthesis adenylyltransferase|uniref:hypothetical protein n=1 Tax=Acidihalobacter sp. TaxID=1872108 RepID=UPI00307D8E4F
MQIPALVAPGDELSREEVNRYSRHLLIPNVGLLGQKRIKKVYRGIASARCLLQDAAEKFEASKSTSRN